MPADSGEPNLAILACTSNSSTPGSRSTLCEWVWAIGHWVYETERRWSGSGLARVRTTTD